ncbi:hypothetical protein M407DRAFT_32229 [Tulasnella calospora MUT 4182]|uniref:DUF4246 domain-containing protein n=1 Tax=Tulasnella calospora MUT 4182 TaxID=1051891 RepID=A0A0C3L9A8_9AGAM|nr:hypothetical protein M407DRAFT_32229 [Tulasnella calospora MUT 4182]
MSLTFKRKQSRVPWPTLRSKFNSIRAKWKEEALRHEIRDGKLSEAEVDWVLDELEDFAKMRDDATGIQPSCHVRVYESDKLIPEQLKANLVAAAAVFENVPKEDKDWHPRSDNMVLDLVHPSLFCTVYGRTLAWTTGQDGKRHFELLKPPVQDQESWSYSEKFSWIPTDFQLGENGEPAKVLGHINNVHPEHHKELVPVIEGLVGRFSLLWDRVLTDLYPANDATLPGRGRVVGMYKWEETENSPPRPAWKEYQELGTEEYNRRYRAWEESRAIVVPTVDKRGYRASGGNIAHREHTDSIQGKKVQVIVKLANIHLTPEKPEYPGGKWHVEGMANERIVASGIYYYDSENITESQLAFRQPVSFADVAYEQSDGRGIELTWGLEEGAGSNQVVGAVKTSADRCIAFPNIYQHQVSSFKLVDLSKPGHRKIVALFLVDPEKRIPSTSDIPPQQVDWAREAIRESLVKDDKSVKVPLPVELADMVADRVDSVMTLDEAKVYREQLMDERTAFVGVVDEMHFATEFSFCEH